MNGLLYISFEGMRPNVRGKETTMELLSTIYFPLGETKVDSALISTFDVSNGSQLIDFLDPEKYYLLK